MTYTPGDVVLECAPLVSVVANKFKGKVCDHCFEFNTALKKCTKCKWMSYCNAACQLADWKAFHKHGECKMIQRNQVENTIFFLQQSFFRLHTVKLNSRTEVDYNRLTMPRDLSIERKNEKFEQSVKEFNLLSKLNCSEKTLNELAGKTYSNMVAIRSMFEFKFVEIGTLIAFSLETECKFVRLRKRKLKTSR
jgi:hypothetical protein